MSFDALDWEICAPRLEAALDGTHSLEDVRVELEANRAELWRVGDSCVVTQFVQYPRCKVLRVWLAAGNLDDLLPNLERLDSVGRDFGCDRIEIEGRRGWGKVLPGYKEQRVVLTKEI